MLKKFLADSMVKSSYGNLVATDH